HALGVSVEIGERGDHLRRDADVRQGRGVAVAEPAGLFLPGEVGLDRLERAQGPVAEPAVARGLVLVHLLFEVAADPRRDQRVPVGGGDEREPAHPGPAARIFRQERRRGPRLLEVLEDRERLEKRRAALVEHERRHHRLRVHRQLLVGVLLALEEVDRDLLGTQALEIQRHAHAIGRERAPETVKLHGFTLIFASLMSFSYFAISSLMNLPNCSGVLDTASTPRSAKRFFTSASASAFLVSAFSLSTMVLGVPAGNSTPHQFTATSPGAASWHGGGSGRSS